MASVVRVTATVKCRLGSEVRSMDAFVPGLTCVLNSSGTVTNTRTMLFCEIRNSSRPTPAFPAFTRSPKSVFRNVITPSNGATIFSNPCICSSLLTAAVAAWTFAVCAARFWLFWSTSCCDTELVLINSW